MVLHEQVQDNSRLTVSLLDFLVAHYLNWVLICEPIVLS